MRNASRIFATGALVLLAACGDDGTGPGDGGDALTQAEIGALLSAFGATTLDAGTGSIGEDGQITTTFECSLGGDIQTTGTVTEDDPGETSFDFTMAYRGCREQSQAGTFLIDGSLREVGRVSFDQDAQSLTFEVDLTGDFDWELDDRSGSCRIDVQLALTEASPTVTYTGSLCGEPVSLT